MLPQITFVIGPKGSGKTSLGQALCKRTNMASIRFGNFVRFRGLDQADDETKVLALINQLAKEIKPRVLIEDFP
jgi:adenylate kinase family enzyme